MAEQISGTHARHVFFLFFQGHPGIPGAVGFPGIPGPAVSKGYHLLIVLHSILYPGCSWVESSNRVLAGLSSKDSL